MNKRNFVQCCFCKYWKPLSSMTHIIINPDDGESGNCFAYATQRYSLRMRSCSNYKCLNNNELKEEENDMQNM